MTEFDKSSSGEPPPRPGFKGLVVVGAIAIVLLSLIVWAGILET